MTATTEPDCPHPEIVVDYEHPHGTLVGVLIATLRRTSAAQSREIMTLRNARCAQCGVALSRRSLGARAKAGGDCFDPRFAWA
jgi:hypothetical protein